MAEPRPTDLVPLTTCHGPVEAMGIRSLLEAEDIEVLVEGENVRGALGMLQGAAIELRVMVRRADLEDARVLLEEVEYAEHLPPEPETGEADDPSIKRFVESHAETDATELDASPRISPRRPGIAIALAIFIPLGTGHIYAQRPKTGMAIGALQLLSYILYFRGWFVLPAVLGLIAFDAIWSQVAIRRDLQRARLPA
jgi:hypothetical protein